MESYSVGNLTEYIKLIEQNCQSENFLFRGQTEDWPLLPKIARVTTKSGVGLLETEAKMLHDFKRISKPYLKTIPLNNWEWLAVAQHHGMATRLLDWSTNPLAALWFTVHSPSTSPNGVIWFFDVPDDAILLQSDLQKMEPFEIENTKVFQPELISSRIQNQNGWFTVHKYLDKKNKFIKFETNARFKKHLKKICIPQSSFFDLRYQLDRMGINRLSLFPDLDGAACYAEWINTLMPDENEKSRMTDMYEIFN